MAAVADNMVLRRRPGQQVIVGYGGYVGYGSCNKSTMIVSPCYRSSTRNR